MDQQGTNVRDNALYAGRRIRAGEILLTVLAFVALIGGA